MNFLKGPAVLFKKVTKGGDIRRIFMNTGWLVADKGARMLMSLIVGVWVARYFGPANFGIYSYSIAFIAIFNAVATLGIDGLVVRDLVNKPQNTNVILGSAVFLRFASSIVATLLAIAFIFILKRDEPTTVHLVSVMAIAFLALPVDVIDLFFQSKLLSKYTILARLSSLTLVNILRVTAVLLSLSLIYFGIIQVLEALLSAAFLLLIYKRLGHRAREWRTDLVYSKQLFKDCYGLLADSVLVILNMQIDRLIIEYYHDDREVGLYAVGVNLSQLWYFIPVFIGASTAPMMITRYQEGKEQYRSVLRFVFKAMGILSLVIALPFTFFSGDVINFLYGASYSEAAAILSLHIWTCIFVYHVSIRSRTLVIEGKAKYVGLFSMTMTALNILLNLILVPKYGGLGAAISSLSSWAASVILLPLLSSRTREYPVYFFRSFYA